MAFLDGFFAHLFSNAIAIALYGWWIGKIHAKKVKELKDRIDKVARLGHEELIGRNEAERKLRHIREFLETK